MIFSNTFTRNDIIFSRPWQEDEYMLSCKFIYLETFISLIVFACMVMIGFVLSSSNFHTAGAEAVMFIIILSLTVSDLKHIDKDNIYPLIMLYIGALGITCGMIINLFSLVSYSAFIIGIMTIGGIVSGTVVSIIMYDIIAKDRSWLQITIMLAVFTIVMITISMIDATISTNYGWAFMLASFFTVIYANDTIFDEIDQQYGVCSNKYAIYFGAKILSGWWLIIADTLDRTHRMLLANRS